VFAYSSVVQCIYAVHKLVIFAVGEEELAEGEEPLSVILERQISYFADEDGLDGLLKHLGNNPWCGIFKVLRNGFNITHVSRSLCGRALTRTSKILFAI